MRRETAAEFRRDKSLSSNIKIAQHAWMSATTEHLYIYIRKNKNNS
jgi:hypothetical protein